MDALVLSGGGSRGAYQAGAWRALEESGYRPQLIVGTSAGSLNGALIAAGTPSAELAAWWGRLRTRDLIRLRRDPWRARRWLGLNDASRLRRLIEGNIDLAALRRGLPFWLTATSLTQGREVAFGAADLTHGHFLASCSLLPGLPPVEVGGELLADGGHTNAFPAHVAVAQGATRITGLLHDPIEPHPEAPPSTFHGLLRVLSDVAWHAQQRAALTALRLQHHVTLTLHAPDPPLTNLILRFDPELARHLVERGYRETQARLT